MSFVTDDFTGTEGTDITSHDAKWLKLYTYDGTLAITDANAAKGTLNQTAGYYYNEAPPSADYAVSLSAQITSGGTPSTGVAARCSNTLNTLYFFRAEHGSNKLQIYRAVSGAFSLLDEVAETLGSSPYTLRIEVEGTGSDVTIRGFFNDVERCSYVDTSGSRITDAGFPGLRINRAHESIIDDFLAEELGGGGAVYDETFSASASSAFTLSDSWALNYAETFGASAASGATFTDTYDTPSVDYDETFAASAASGTELTEAWSLDYSETFSATAASGATLTDAWLLNYAETFAASSTAALDLTDTWALDYAETVSASATSGCDMAHSYAVGNDYVETFAASSVSVATLTHAYSVQYAETFAATALADCSLVAAWALDYAETFAAATASGAVFTEAYETPAPGVFDETFAASSVSACDLTHAFSTPAAIGRVINPTLAASGVPARTLKGLKLIN